MRSTGAEVHLVTAYYLAAHSLQERVPPLIFDPTNIPLIGYFALTVLHCLNTDPLRQIQDHLGS